jgi:hypothetical protein
VAGQEGAHRLPQRISHLLEAEAADVAEVDHIPICHTELG